MWRRAQAVGGAKWAPWNLRENQNFGKICWTGTIQVQCQSTATAPDVPDLLRERINQDRIRAQLRILIHNSDSPKNRGDRAILVGIIELTRRRWPDAEIWSLSQYPERDEEWFGIKFLPQSPYSTNPIEWLALLRLARRSDIILWGGGEIMKDYTNRLGLIYWYVKLTALRMVNPSIVGAFQGIGPTSAASSKRLIARTANRTKVFITRDDESRQKLVDWGVRRPVVASFDPAVMGQPSTFDAALEARLVESADIDALFLRGAMGFGLRRWFHYRQSGFLPAKYRKSFDRSEREESADLVSYRLRVAELADRLIEKHDAGLVFFPMHMDPSEGDSEFAESVVALMKNADRTRILATDSFSSNDYAAVIGQLRFFVASRLHSAILATMANVPSYVLYYVDKGRLFFEQLGMQRYSAPIASILEEGAVDRLFDALEGLVKDSKAVKIELATAIHGMSSAIETDFAAALDEAGLR
jgi:polysaccharide pyruvyl transferase WcaK-like protein